MLLQLELTIGTAGYVVIANPRLVVTAIVIAAWYWLAGAWGNAGKPDGAAVRTTLVLLANGLTLVFLDQRDHRLLAGARRGAPWTSRKPAGPRRYVVACLVAYATAADRRRHPPPDTPRSGTSPCCSSPSRS